VVKYLGDPEGVLVIEETGFVKKGTRVLACSGSIRAPPDGWRTARSEYF
jgi:hypothetical protein